MRHGPHVYSQGMEVLGGYADTEARETHEPPVQHATHFPNVDYKLACATHGPHPDLLRIRNTFFFSPYSNCRPLAPARSDQGQLSHVEGHSLPTAAQHPEIPPYTRGRPLTKGLHFGLTGRHHRGGTYCTALSTRHQLY